MGDQKRWYQKTLGIIVLLILFFPVGILLMWKHTDWNKKIKWTVTILLILIVLIGVTSNNSTSKINDETMEQAGKTSTPQSTGEKGKPLYEKFSYQELATVENLVFVYNGQDKSEQYLESLARQIKGELCKKPCNISIFDDKKAAELDAELHSIKNEVQEKEWKRNNYVFVAEHFPAHLEFEGDGLFFYYMYKDWLYKELKGSQ